MICFQGWHFGVPQGNETRRLSRDDVDTQGITHYNQTVARSQGLSRNLNTLKDRGTENQRRRSSIRRRRPGVSNDTTPPNRINSRETSQNIQNDSTNACNALDDLAAHVKGTCPTSRSGGNSSNQRNRRCPQRGRGNRGSCFVAGTLVRTEGGLLPIESVTAEDRVWTFNPALQTWCWDEVVETFVREYTGVMVSVHVGDEVIVSTARHPFWVVRGDRLEERPLLSELGDDNSMAMVEGRWVEAQCLQLGDALLTADGEMEVADLSHSEETVDVYNLHIEQCHTYAVGERGVLVHNTSDPCAIANPPLSAVGEARYRYRNIQVNTNRPTGAPRWETERVFWSVRALLKNQGVAIDGTGGSEPDDEVRDWVQNTVGRVDDDAGHVIGARFGGTGAEGNIYPQGRETNRITQNTREDRLSIQLWSTTVKSCRVCVQITAIYANVNNGPTFYRARPTGFAYRIWVDDMEFEPFNAVFGNPPSL